MVEPQAATASPTGASFFGTLGHFIKGGLLGGALGLVFAGLVFYVLVIGFLYCEQPIHGAAQTAIAIPYVDGAVLTPPIAALDLEPPDGKQDKSIDMDYLAACWDLFWAAVDNPNVLRALAVWAAVAALFGLAVGVVGSLVRVAYGEYLSPLWGFFALLAALAGIGVLVAHFHYQMELPLPMDDQGRLLLYTAVTLMNLLWISTAGFRFRALLFILATVVVGEGLNLGLPPPAWTTTALWHACLFLFVPAGYGWLAVERGQDKGIIA